MKKTYHIQRDMIRYMITEHKVLDKGFIDVLDSLGDDLTVANSARVSFGKRKKHMIKVMND